MVAHTFYFHDTFMTLVVSEKRKVQQILQFQCGPYFVIINRDLSGENIFYGREQILQQKLFRGSIFFTKCGPGHVLGVQILCNNLT